MAVVPEVFVKRLHISSHHRGINSRISFSRFIIGLMSVIVGISAVTGIVYFATRKYDWINVHLVPHTHDDVGWLKTPEEYYDFSVRWILTHVVKELQKNSQRNEVRKGDSISRDGVDNGLIDEDFIVLALNIPPFVYVETYFFWKWWNQQTEETKKIVRKLVKNGQLEMIGGGFTMSDEAVVHYQSFIDQSTWGFRRLNDTFGRDVKLNMAWQIDTFGHSKEIAALLAQMGFEALFFARIDIDDRRFRKARKFMEFVWDANKNLGSSAQIFTSIFYDHYSSPRGFDFETEPVEYPIELREFATYAREHAETMRTNNILVPMGDDFRYFYAHNYFQKIDDLIRGFSENQEYKIRVFYSTPSQYIQALKDSGANWPSFSGDFFPYGSEKHMYWTGYFTSRPSLKYLERITNNFLQISKQLLVFSSLGHEFSSELTVLREAMAVLQHHDAVTGTSKQYVTDHYVELLAEGIHNCEEPINRALKRLMGAGEDDQRLSYQSCLLLNISECAVTTESTSFVVTVYNPLNRPVDEYVRFPVSGTRYTVQTKSGEYVETQLLDIPKSVLYIPGRDPTAKTELMFKASDVPPMGFRSYYVTQAPQRRTSRRKRDKKARKSAKVEVGFDESTGLLSSVTINGKCIPFSQSIRHYIGSQHWTGAYIFRPEEQYTEQLEPGTAEVSELNDGELIAEYEQVFSHWGSQIIRIYKDEEYVEFEWLVGPIPTSDFRGKEVVVMYSTDINNENVFYTDLNGRGMEERVRDYRHWGTRISEPVAGNYYPVTTQIGIKDENSQMYVLTDRPQGGSSIASGSIELMVHRRLCFDDGKGVTEPLSEEAFGFGLVARGKHWLVLGDAKDETFGQRVKLISQEKHSRPWLFFANSEAVSFREWSGLRTEFTGVTRLTTPNFRVLTLEPWTAKTQLLRVENIFESTPLTTLSGRATVSLKYLFQNFVITEARETTLGANMWLSESRRADWFGGNRYPKIRKDTLDGNMTVVIEPEHIRTFIIKMRPIEETWL